MARRSQQRRREEGGKKKGQWIPQHLLPCPRLLPLPIRLHQPQTCCWKCTWAPQYSNLAQVTLSHLFHRWLSLCCIHINSRCTSCRREKVLLLLLLLLLLPLPHSHRRLHPLEPLLLHHHHHRAAWSFPLLPSVYSASLFVSTSTCLLSPGWRAFPLATCAGVRLAPPRRGRGPPCSLHLPQQPMQG
jgi:hypothetical protein